MCIDQGVFPDAFKYSPVTPVHKNGATANVSNHRPVSVLCNLNNIFECIIFNGMHDLFNRNGQLFGNQFSFMKKKY